MDNEVKLKLWPRMDILLNNFITVMCAHTHTKQFQIE